MSAEAPLRFSHVLRLERLHLDLVDLARAVGATPGCKVYMEEINGKLVYARQHGDASHAKYVEALIALAPGAVCRVCRIYASDYRCLGYPLPSPCQLDECQLP